MSLKAWRSIFEGFLEVSPKHRKQHDAPGKTACRRRAQRASERAQRAKRAERLRCLSASSSGFSGRFTETTEKNTTRRRNENNKTRFPFPYLDRFMLGGFSSQNAPRGGRTRQRRAKTHPRRPKMPRDPLRTAKTTTKSSQVGTNIA